MPHTAAEVVIFDLDGLLLDSESAIIEVAEDVCRKYGKELTPEAVAKALGRSPSMAWQITADILGIDRTGDELFLESEELLKEKWASTKLMPGALRLLKHLKAKGIPVGLATSTSSQRIHVKMQGKEHVVDMFDFKVFGDEVKNGKPDPEIYWEAARRAGVPPERCLVVEDSPCGVKSACAAGMRVVAVPSISDTSKYPAAAPDADSGCCEHLASLLDFRPEKYGLPPFEDYIGEITPLEPAWTLKGTVVKGFGRGSKVLGIPTANVDMKSVKEQLGMAVCGIYCGYASLSTTGGSNVYPFAMSIGRNPQFNNQEKSAEPWLLHTFDGDFYGAEIRLIILGYIRHESAFSSLEALIQRIHRDAEVSREFLERSEEAKKARNDPFLKDFIKDQ